MPRGGVQGSARCGLITSAAYLRQAYETSLVHDRMRVRKCAVVLLSSRLRVQALCRAVSLFAGGVFLFRNSEELFSL